MTEIQELRADIAVLTEKVEESTGVQIRQEVLVTRMDKEVFGNGGPGLIKEMVRIRTLMKINMGVFAVVGVSTVAALVALFFQGIQHSP